MKKHKKFQKPIPLVKNPIDLFGIGFTFIALIVMFNLSTKYAGNQQFQSVSIDAMKLFIKGLLGLGIVFIVHFIYRFVINRENPFKRMNSSKLIGSNVDLNDPWFMISLLGATVSYFIIQFAGMFLFNLKLFQSVATDVYAFYFASAVLEETLYRMGILLLIETIFNLIFQEQHDKIFQIFSGMIAIGVSTFFFVIAHERYFNDPVALFITIFGGLSQGFWYWKSKSMIPVIFAHVLVNLIASGSMIQTLSAPALILFSMI